MTARAPKTLLPAAVELPLFPLRTVLFPEGPLPLRIFEPRYLAMVSRCLKRGEPFVVCLALDGGAAGKARCASVGTSARIVDFGQAQDGLLTLATVGERRVRLRAVRVEAEGFEVGEFEWLDPEPAAVPGPRDAACVALAHELIGDDDDAYRGLPRRWDDATWLGYRLAEQLPIELAQKQQLLELEDPRERLAVLEPVAVAISATR